MNDAAEASPGPVGGNIGLHKERDIGAVKEVIEIG